MRDLHLVAGGDSMGRGLFWAVRSEPPALTNLAGGLIGAGAFSFAFVATRQGCADDSLHILTWHVIPVAAGTALSIFCRFRLATASWRRQTPEFRPLPRVTPASKILLPGCFAARTHALYEIAAQHV
jgi:hypothetical protein